MMEYTAINDYNISKLILGTVSLGMNYGISNTEGQPDFRQRLDVLSNAWEAGINTLDTARTYGAAEETVGDYLAVNNFEQPFNIISKFKINNDNLNSYDSAREAAFESVRCSLQKLRIPEIPICLLHMSRELNEKRVREYVPLIFKELQQQNLIGMAGISIDHPRELEWFEKEPVISSFQVPLNIFDHRLLRDDILQRIHDSGKLIFARSIFLQGLFFLHPDQLKGNLIAAKPLLEQLHLLADREGITVAALAFAYVRHMRPVTSIVFGAEHVSQVEQNVRLMNMPELKRSVMDKISELFSDVPEDIITPGNWTV